MFRFAVAGVIVGIAFTIYALVDAAMSDAARVRALSKRAWVVVIALLPVIGAILWFTIGRPRGSVHPRGLAPDDDPRFSLPKLSQAEIDAHVRELEERLQELDNEEFPGVDRPRRNSANNGEGARAATEAADATEAASVDAVTDSEGGSSVEGVGDTAGELGAEGGNRTDPEGDHSPDQPR